MKTDPTGLFTLSEIINGYGLASLDELLNAARYGSYQPSLRGRWGWLALLLEAKTGDVVQYAAPLTVLPFLDEGLPGVASDAAGTITIGGSRLADYTRDQVDHSMTGFIPWRNTKPTTYLLNEQQYIEASRPRDLPDFRIVSLDIVPFVLAGLGIVPLAVCGKAFTGGGSAYIDRYGATYGAFFLGVQGSCLGYLSAGEGYVTRNPMALISGNRDIPSPSEVADTISGPCINGEVHVGIGLSGNICKNGAAAFDGFYTPGAGGAIYLSAAAPLPGQHPDLAWDYIDREKGIGEDDVIRLITSRTDCR